MSQQDKQVWAFSVKNDYDSIGDEFIVVYSDKDDLKAAVSLAFQTYCDALGFGMDYANIDMYGPNESWCAIGHIPEEEMDVTFEQVPAHLTIGGFGVILLDKVIKDENKLSE